MSVAKQITEVIKTLAKGESFTATKFLSIGSRANVDQVLTRLIKRGMITRIARGIYVKPKHNQYVGAVIPSPMEVAQSLAKATGSVVQVHGAEAVRQLGLSTQVPMRPIFLTTGQSRRFHLGKLEVVLKHVTPRKLACAGTKTGLVITALWYLGKEQVTSQTIEHIKKKLSSKEFATLKNESANLPAWMSNLLYRYEQGNAYA